MIKSTSKKIKCNSHISYDFNNFVNSRKYMKENGVDIMHLHAISSVFLDCDEQRTGIVTKKQLLLQIHEQNMKFPADFLFNLISDIQENPED